MKKMEYLIRYDDNNMINTVYCENKSSMIDITNILDNDNIPYTVVSLKNYDEFRLHCLTDFSDTFGIGE